MLKTNQNQKPSIASKVIFDVKDGFLTSVKSELGKKNQRLLFLAKAIAEHYKLSEPMLLKLAICNSRPRSALFIEEQVFITPHNENYTVWNRLTNKKDTMSYCQTLNYVKQFQRKTN